MPCHFPGVRGKSVLIIGGATGSGALAVKIFIRHGCRVAFLHYPAETQRAVELCEDLAREPWHKGGTSLPLTHHACDMTDAGPRYRKVKAAVKDLQYRVDVLVHNMEYSPLGRYAWSPLAGVKCVPESVLESEGPLTFSPPRLMFHTSTTLLVDYLAKDRNGSKVIYVFSVESTAPFDPQFHEQIIEDAKKARNVHRENGLCEGVVVEIITPRWSMDLHSGIEGTAVQDLKDMTDAHRIMHLAGTTRAARRARPELRGPAGQDSQPHARPGLGGSPPAGQDSQPHARPELGGSPPVGQDSQPQARPEPQRSPPAGEDSRSQARPEPQGSPPAGEDSQSHYMATPSPRCGFRHIDKIRDAFKSIVRKKLASEGVRFGATYLWRPE